MKLDVVAVSYEDVQLDSQVRFSFTAGVDISGTASNLCFCSRVFRASLIRCGWRKPMFWFQ
jgi:hypothetical protein